MMKASIVVRRSGVYLAVPRGLPERRFAAVFAVSAVLVPAEWARISRSSRRRAAVSTRMATPVSTRRRVKYFAAVGIGAQVLRLLHSRGIRRVAVKLYPI